MKRASERALQGAGRRGRSQNRHAREPRACEPPRHRAVEAPRQGPVAEAIAVAKVAEAIAGAIAGAKVAGAIVGAKVARAKAGAIAGATPATGEGAGRGRP